MSEVKLGWASAEVKNAKLTVALDGEVPKGWKESFERTLRLLGDGEWEPVELKKDSVQVAEVTPGTEEKLRHHLEAIVAQANAALERSENEGQGEDGDEDEPQGPDAEMTAQFRAFAEQEEAPEA
jgi:hypothetical protein